MVQAVQTDLAGLTEAAALVVKRELAVQMVPMEVAERVAQAEAAAQVVLVAKMEVAVLMVAVALMVAAEQAAKRAQVELMEAAV
jgi:hypothetical protein